MVNCQRGFSGEIVTGKTFRRASKANRHYFYQAYPFEVKRDEDYVFVSESATDLFGLIYKDAFHPNDSRTNMITLNDDAGPNYGFSIDIPLKEKVTYILVVTTFEPLAIGKFNVRIKNDGPPVEFKMPLAPITAISISEMRRRLFSFEMILEISLLQLADRCISKG